VRVGIMLRTFDEVGGIAVYSRGLVRTLLEIDRSNQYFLLYREPRHLGTFSDFKNATEIVVSGLGKAVWDQISVPIVCKQTRIDVLLHPKFTVPFLAPCKTVMVVHGADWFVPEQAKFYNWVDVRYIRTVMPWYFRRASKVISVSQGTTENFRRVVKPAADKIRTIYFGPAAQFRPVTDPDELKRVKTRYDLPDRFALTLTKRAGDERKNLRGILAAYELYHRQSKQPAHLVIGGKDCHLFRGEYQIPDRGYGADISFPGLIDQDDLPAVLSQAEVFLYPSYLEAFPIPLTEAMGCGTPIITSNVNGLKEIAGDAAVYVDPARPDSIAGAIREVIADPELRRILSDKGRTRSTLFDWTRCGRETLAVLNEVHGAGG
jgi:glycosyltransferase involved in cell wall biosynthesis